MHEGEAMALLKTIGWVKELNADRTKSNNNIVMPSTPLMDLCAHALTLPRERARKNVDMHSRERKDIHVITTLAIALPLFRKNKHFSNPIFIWLNY